MRATAGLRKNEHMCVVCVCACACRRGESFNEHHAGYVVLTQASAWDLRWVTEQIRVIRLWILWIRPTGKPHSSFRLF